MKLIIQALILLLPAAMCAQVSLVASASKNPVGINEQFELKYTAVNTGVQITPPVLEGFKIINGPNKSSSTVYKDGKTKSESSLTYTLSIGKEGRINIGAASLIDGGETHYSNEINILVRENDEASSLIKEIKAVADEDDDDEIIFKDGESMPGRKVFVKECTDELEADHDKGDPVLNNKKVCNCMMDAIGRQYTYSEFIKLSNKKGKGGLVASMSDKKSPLFSEAVKCVIQNMESSGGDDTEDEAVESKSSSKGTSVFDTDNKEIQTAFISSCEEAAKKSKEFKSVSIDFNMYCTCTWDKIREYGLSLSDLEQLSDPNSMVFNNVITPCLSRAMGVEEKPGSKAPATPEVKGADIVGGGETERVALVRQMSVYKLKVKAGDVEKYFILDSGAGDVFISSDYERELLLEGLIRKQDYKSSRTYTMANGKQIECRRVVLNNIQVGGYTVNNITAAISDEKNAMMLLGKSFLDKFSNWSIDNNTGELVLTK